MHDVHDRTLAAIPTVIDREHEPPIARHSDPRNVTLVLAPICHRRVTARATPPPPPASAHGHSHTQSHTLSVSPWQTPTNTPETHKHSTAPRAPCEVEVRDAVPHGRQEPVAVGREHQVAALVHRAAQIRKLQQHTGRSVSRTAAGSVKGGTQTAALLQPHLETRGRCRRHSCRHVIDALISCSKGQND
jgi:hypothetical protein